MTLNSTTLTLLTALPKTGAYFSFYISDSLRLGYASNSKHSIKVMSCV